MELPVQEGVGADLQDGEDGEDEAVIWMRQHHGLAAFAKAMGEVMREEAKWRLKLMLPPDKLEALVPSVVRQMAVYARYGPTE